jgi:uncharacterized protein with GYD domain
MPTYVVLGKYTDQGVRNIKRVMPQIAAAAEQWVAAQKGRVIGNYTTLGVYDYVFVCDLPSDEVALEGALTFSSQGNVSTQVLRAWPVADAIKVTERIP